MFAKNEYQQANTEEYGQSETFFRNNKKPQNTQYAVIVLFVIIACSLGLYKIYISSQQDKMDARFYRKQLMSLQMIDFWKLSGEQMIKEQTDKQKNILGGSKHKISRKELGHSSWTLLHMITGGFPDEIDYILVKKFNAFLVLFGQMYPCKMCANHFMELLKSEGLFQGSTKKQLMIYVCNLHNKVNERLGKPIHDCSEVYDEWNTCGCSGGEQEQG